MAQETNDSNQYGDININVTVSGTEEDGQDGQQRGCGCGCNPCCCAKEQKPTVSITPKVTVIQKHYHAGGCCPPVAPIGFHNQIWGTHSTHCPGDDCGCVETTTNCPEK